MIKRNFHKASGRHFRTRTMHALCNIALSEMNSLIFSHASVSLWLDLALAVMAILVPPCGSNFGNALSY